MTFDQAFARVIEACSQARNYDEDTWITDDVKDAYVELHHAGLAHSVETWQDGELVGGLYGVSVGKIFCGESMFSRRSDASKVALVHLVAWLKEHEYQFIDCQVNNPYLSSMGTVEVCRQEFLELLNKYK